MRWNGTQDEAAILLGEEARDPPVVGHRVQFHLPAALTSVILEQPAGGIEGVAYGHVDVLVGMVLRRIAADGDLAAGDLEVNADPEQIALPATRVAAFDNDPA